jgi:simple sugar transport system permease protein
LARHCLRKILLFGRQSSEPRFCGTFSTEPNWAFIAAVGENAEAARAIGYPVGAIRCAAVAVGGGMCGLAGAYASTVYTPLWADGMIAGRGWIALALVVFGTWQTGRVAFGAVLFGVLSLGELTAQAIGVAIPSQVLSSLPYFVTILMLVAIARHRRS